MAGLCHCVLCKDTDQFSAACLLAYDGLHDELPKGSALKAVKAVFKDGILKEQGVRRHVRKNDRISYDVYSLELVIAVAFRIDSIESRAFREFIMQSVIGKQTSRTKLVCIFTENAMA